MSCVQLWFLLKASSCAMRYVKVICDIDPRLVDDSFEFSFEFKCCGINLVLFEFAIR